MSPCQGGLALKPSLLSPVLVDKVARPHRICPGFVEPGQFFKNVAVSGWSGPNTFSKIASAHRYSGSASSYFPTTSRKSPVLVDTVARPIVFALVFVEPGRFFKDVAVSGWS